MKIKLWSCLFSVSLVSSLSSCMKIKPKIEASEENPVATVQSRGKVKAQFISVGPNQYEVLFQFVGVPSAVFMVKTMGGIKNSELIALDNQNWTDTRVHAGEEVHYEFGSLKADRSFEVWDSLDLKIPRDLVVDRVLDLNDEKTQNLFVLSKQGSSQNLQVKSFARIYFLEGGVINLNGRSLQIEAEEIHSENGLIQTFAAGTKAEKGKPGRSGGSVQIKAAMATGTLKIEMRGENGGDGIAAPPPDTALKGAAGAQGEPGTRDRSADDGLGNRVWTCLKQPTRGFPGQKGLQGYAGGNGQQGGSSGSLNVQVLEEKEISLIASSFVGHGGDGALGGEGGAGGDGGLPGALPYVNGNEGFKCDQYPGAPGPQGDRGISGVAGADGAKEPICEIKNQQPKICY